MLSIYIYIYICTYIYIYIYILITYCETPEVALCFRASQGGQRRSPPDAANRRPEAARVPRSRPGEYLEGRGT